MSHIALFQGGPFDGERREVPKVAHPTKDEPAGTISVKVWGVDPSGVPMAYFEQYLRDREPRPGLMVAGRDFEWDYRHLTSNNTPAAPATTGE